MNNTILYSNSDLANVSGKIPYNMTNDYMFRAVLQKNHMVLAGLVGALLHLNPEKLDAVITNPIVLGKSIDDKDFVLDIQVTVNEYAKLNLEMQVVNYGNWKERSLSYLCRSFDGLAKGRDYVDAAPAIHIGFIDFTLFEDTPEFYATYKMTNVKNHKIYTDKLQLSVIELRNTDLATEEDRHYQIDQWARLFKAGTWEELKAMAMTNRYMESAVNTIYELSSDESVREQCRRRAEYERYQKLREEKIAVLSKAVADKDAEIADIKAEIAGKDAEIADIKAETAELKRLLAEALEKIHTNQ